MASNGIKDRVAIVGMGNVMVDIARWLMLDSSHAKPEEIVVVARRGPFEAKFDDKEFAYIHSYLDRQAFACCEASPGSGHPADSRPRRTSSPKEVIRKA